MKHRLWLVSTILLLWPGRMLEATPPQAMTLTYDAEAQNLRVDIEHTSRDLNKHYIRRITVQVNDGEEESSYYQRQPAAYDFTYELPVTAADGDTITVRAYCKDGGTKEESITVMGASGTTAMPIEAPAEPVMKAPDNDDGGWGY